MDSSDYHFHSYTIQTSYANGHIHGMCGVTGPTAPIGYSHVHYYEGRTSLNQGHVHCFRNCTGPSIPCPGGGHIHCMNGCTSIDHYHSHFYGSSTGNEEKSMLFKKAY